MRKHGSQRIVKPKMYTFIAMSILVLCGVGIYALVPRNSVNNEPNMSSQAAIQSNRTYNAYASIATSDIQNVGSEVDFVWNPDEYPIVALVYVNSIDGGRTYSPVFEQYVAPHTYGKMTVRETYRGGVKAGQELSYSRLGGTVSYEDYWKSLNKQQQDKILYLNGGKQPAHKAYVKDKSVDDIDLETGKEYVVFLTPQSSKNGAVQEYVIGGYELGLREAKRSDTELTVLNNKTKHWDKIDDVVKKK